MCAAGGARVAGGCAGPQGAVVSQADGGAWSLAKPLLWPSPRSGLAAYSTSVDLGPEGQVLGKYGFTWGGRPESAALGGS